MMKSIVAVMTAILFCRPTMPQAIAAADAKIVVERSAKLGIDPLLVVANVDRESRWQEWAINPKSGARGLGQVLPEYRPQCVGSASKSAACAEEKKKLLDGAYNLGVAIDALGAWQVFCKKKTGYWSEESILQAYQGLNVPKTNVWCGATVVSGKWTPTKLPAITRAVMQRRRALRLRLEAMGS
jgi:hypothetical protein